MSSPVNIRTSLSVLLNAQSDRELDIELFRGAVAGLNNGAPYPEIHGAAMAFISLILDSPVVEEAKAKASPRERPLYEALPGAVAAYGLTIMKDKEKANPEVAAKLLTRVAEMLNLDALGEEADLDRHNSPSTFYRIFDAFNQANGDAANA